MNKSLLKGDHLIENHHYDKELSQATRTTGHYIYFKFFLLSNKNFYKYVKTLESVCS